MASFDQSSIHGNQIMLSVSFGVEKFKHQWSVIDVFLGELIQVGPVLIKLP